MAVITLTTDWGSKDWYIGAMKGVILSRVDDVRIIDITHEIEPFNVLSASFVLRNCYHAFPEGTVHIVGVNNQDPKTMPYLIIKHEGHYFIGSDNGVFSLVCGKVPEEIYKLRIDENDSIHSFPSMSYFADAACHILSGGELEHIAEPFTNSLERKRSVPTLGDNTIKGSVIYVDAYGNVVTNITKEIFNEVSKGRNYKINFVRSSYVIEDLVNSYVQVPEGEMLALFNSGGHLEIAINKGKAHGLLGLKLGDSINVEFLNNSTNLLF